MPEIVLTQGKVARLDDQDFDEHNQFNWYAQQYKNTWYACRHPTGSPNAHIRMHCAIMKAFNGFEVDHKDGDGLNNTRQNLRYATKSQNQANRGKPSNNSSGYKGVSWDKGRERWHVAIGIKGKSENLGRFDDIIEAALAYDRAAYLYFGEFAILNFPFGRPTQ